ncbi:MAG: hypothetical protein J3Q66DRAFT_445053 [Benniella sp.]|nr:MAG: hypothetical protein J3Q66DRAFT_445053 [Benniella sp.]
MGYLEMSHTLAIQAMNAFDFEALNQTTSWICNGTDMVAKFRRRCGKKVLVQKWTGMICIARGEREEKIKAKRVTTIEAVRKDKAAAKSEDFKKCEEDRSKIQVGLACTLLHIYWTLPEWAKSSFKDISVYGILMAGLSMTLHEARWTTQGLWRLLKWDTSKSSPTALEHQAF